MDDRAVDGVARGADPDAARERALRRRKNAALWAIVGANLVFPVLLWFSRPDKPWRAFQDETSSINWFSAIQLAVIALIAFAIYRVASRRPAPAAGSRKRTWPWLVLAAGFLLLAFDERLAIHETVRESYLKPRGVFTNVAGLHPGDIVLLAYLVAGAVLAVYLFPLLRPHRVALILFLVALALSAVFVVEDSLDLPFLQQRSVRHVQIVAEEVGEIWSQAIFGISLITVLFAELRDRSR